MTLDKQITMQIFGCIMKQPELLSEVENYSLIPSDFESSFEKYIFMSLANLHREGVEVITVVDVDNYLAEKPHIYEIFNKYNGIEYLQDALDMAEVSNFNYYYNKLKKYNVIKDLKSLGYDTNSIYPDKDFLTEDDYKKREDFDNISVTEIFNQIKANISDIEAKYGCSAATTVKANDRIKDLIDRLQSSPEVGMPCQGDIFNTITRGARKGKYYLISALSGGSKTRTMVGNACYIAYPIRYDSNSQSWVNLGNCEKVLYVGTEQVHEEIQTMILAYLTDINEEIILKGNYTPEEADRINKAIKIMDMYSDNFIISQLPEPNLEQVRTHLRKYCLREGCEYVFYDYIFATPSLLNEFRDLSIRQDVALRMLSTLLKDLAVELDVFVMSATQITGTVEFKPGYIRNYMLLRDSKSIPDKADFAAIKAKVLPEELNLLSNVCEKIGVYPNQVTDVYKMRRGRYVDVRIWSYVDLGTLRTKDLFITDANLMSVENLQIEQTVIDYDNLDKVVEFIDLLNDGVVSQQIEEELKNTEENNININNVENDTTAAVETDTTTDTENLTQEDWDAMF